MSGTRGAALALTAVAALGATVALGAAVALALSPAVARTASPSPSPAATPAPAVPSNPYADEAWWVPLGERGTVLTRVVEAGGRITVTTSAGAALDSTDGGRTFHPSASPPPPGGDADVTSGGDRWRIRSGAVLHGTGDGAFARDPGSPDLGTDARLLAAPAATPGVVVAVSDRGVVWRRTAAGAWAASLVLLPRSIVGGTPAITDLTAFTETTAAGGISATVYLATDGYSVLATSDGGDDWFRDDPGLPGAVHALAAASDLGAVLAATDDGLWVHHLRVPPSIPVYPGPDLRARQLWIGAISAGTCAAAPAGLWLALRAGPRRRRDGAAEMR